MPVVSSAYVKNIVRRGFSQLVDPGPDAKAQAQIWEFFRSQCAFCGATLKKGAKEGHIDHLVSASGGGANHLGNRVLACAPCNEKEKRDAHWEHFLTTKARSPQELLERRSRILEWQTLHKEVIGSASPEVQAAALAAAAEVNGLFEKKVAEIRAMMRSATLPNS